MDNKNNIDDFFGDILDNDDSTPLFETTNEEEIDFDFDDDTDLEEDIEEIEEPIKEVPKQKYKDKESYKRTKDDIQESVAELQGSINSMLKTIDKKPEDMFPDPDLLPGLDIDVEYHDYEQDLELIKIESKETLECLANLYLTEDTMKTKNVYNIIKDDSKLLSRLNFSISMGQRSLILCMKQLDMGVNDPLMYQSVTMFMKEIRDNVKMAYDLQKKMKEFYRELKGELQEINAGQEEMMDAEDNYTIVGDPKMLNDLFERMKNDPSLLNDMMNQQNNKKGTK